MEAVDGVFQFVHFLLRFKLAMKLRTCFCLAVVAVTASLVWYAASHSDANINDNNLYTFNTNHISRPGHSGCSENTTSDDASRAPCPVYPPPVPNVSCQRLLQADQQELWKAMALMSYPGGGPEDKTVQEYELRTKDCRKYRRVTGVRGRGSVNKEELDFPLAFSVLVYKDADQVERLVRAIYRPHNVYCLHVDAKSDQHFRRKLELFSQCLPNVFLSRYSVNVTWATASTLEADLTCMRQLLRHAVQWRYVINLTGQEFPLRTNRELVQILTLFDGANLIEGDTEHEKWRWESYLPAPHNLTVFKGSTHVAMTRLFVDYILHGRVARDLLDWMHDVPVPDEMFFNTLNHNPSLGAPGSLAVSQNTSGQLGFLRYKVWFTPGWAGPCEGRVVRMICHLGAGDLLRITTSPALFANKFTYDYQPLAYDCLEQWFFRRLRQEAEGTAEGTAEEIKQTPYETVAKDWKKYTGPIKIW